MYEIYVAVRFEAAHRLVGDFGPATRTHGHTYRMEVIVRGKHLGDDGTLYDIGGLGQAVEGLAGSMHYRNLNEVPGLEGVNTTAEAVASYCWDKLAEPLRGQGLDSLTVRIWESPDAYAAREDALA
ncbi:MAG TPA: 6-carboxytetrahydropterin synthase [Rubrobacter sp.]|jgi:6-pyruvoyltetrahydropterin/6-carboxytetrahydropterin synthase|nr:6-carboxytetrahydropterin synthase [Rubrobacter sp.]